MKNSLTKSFLLIAMVAFSVVLVGCDHAVDPAIPVEKVVPVAFDEELVGTWIWEKTAMNNDTVINPVQKKAFSLTFDAKENKVSGTTDCNNFFGTYSLSEDGIEFGPIALTRKFCKNSQEQEFSNMITESTSYMFTKEGNLVLLLKMDAGSVIFTKKVKEATKDMRNACLKGNGKWLPKYKECEYVSQRSCKNMGGVFDACGSACRHGESEGNKPVACTMKCVPVCVVK